MKIQPAIIMTTEIDQDTKQCLYYKISRSIQDFLTILRSEERSYYKWLSLPEFSLMILLQKPLAKGLKVNIKRWSYEQSYAAIGS